MPKKSTASKTSFFTVACLLTLCCASTTAAVRSLDSLPHETVRDPVRKYLPGKYYERMALESLRQHDYSGALTAYQKAAYWANKVAQYNLGEIYFRGLGSIAADRPRGVAWLGIAAEEHEPDYDKALTRAYASLDAGERRQADQIWKKLQPVYGDKATLARATSLFNGYYNSELAQSSMTEEYDPTAYSVWIDGFYNPDTNAASEGDLLAQLQDVSVTNPVTVPLTFWSGLKQQFNDFIARQFGHVEVGPIQQLAAPAKSPER